MYDKPLTNLDNTLYYDENGLITQRVGISGGSVSISGPVTIPGTVTVNSTPASPVHVHLTEMGAVDLTTATSLPVSGSVSVSGTVSISSLPEVEIKNDAGNPVSISKNSTANSSSNRIFVSQETDAVLADSNYFFNVSRGLVPGHSVLVRNAFNPDVSANTETSIWVEGGIYPHAEWTTAQPIYVISTSAADTGQTIYIEGLDANYNIQTEMITTTGQTARVTVNNYIRIHTATVVAGTANAGEITFRLASGTGTVVAHIRAGFGITKLSQYTVPAGKTAYILYGAATSFRGGSGNIGSQIRMMVRPYGGVFVMAYIAEVVNGQYRDDFPAPMVVPEKADIDVRCLADANNTLFSATYSMILINN